MTVPPEPTRRRVVLPENGTPVVVDPPADGLWRQEVTERLSNHVIGITVALLLSVVALALSGWLWLADDDDGAGGGSSSGRVQLLEKRVQTLEGSHSALATKDELKAYAEQQEALDARVRQLGDASQAPGVDTAALETAIDATQQSLDQLASRVAALEQQSP